MQEENNKLYVGNLPYSITDDQLFELFNSLEEVEVTEAKVIIDKMTGRPRGFGFVTVANAEMAQKAIDLMNNKEIEGRTIFVNISRPQTKDFDRNRQGGSGNRNFGGGRSYDRR